ncbi:MAG: DUF1015 domain-containing protein [Cyclobacteriaceae bacterium]
MAKIRALRAWRYQDKLAENIGELISPPFDVVSQKQREALYRNPLNSIHLSVPPGNRPAEHAADMLQRWKAEGILQQDEEAGMYVYYQYFKLPGESREYCRKGFICFIEAAFWEERVVLRHENTIPASVNDRIELLENTLLNASPTHGLYTDEQHRLENYMDECMQSPIYQVEDYQGVRDVIGVIRDPEIISIFIRTMADKQIILADGHHRYESSLAYRDKCIQANPSHHGEEGYNYHLMYLTNTETEDLKILPTHRLLQDLPHFNPEDILKHCSEYFDMREQDNPHDLLEVIAGKVQTFGLVMENQAFKIRLKPALQQQINWSLSESVRELDIVTLHYFFLEKIMGIAREEQRSSPRISYERSFANCLYKVARKEAQMALITNAVTIGQVKDICYSGQLLPQKSTFFYPKAICGFLFGSIQEHEFQTHIGV